MSEQNPCAPRRSFRFERRPTAPHVARRKRSKPGQRSCTRLHHRVTGDAIYRNDIGMPTTSGIHAGKQPASCRNSVVLKVDPQQPRR
jgi:hypothetical protein